MDCTGKENVTISLINCKIIMIDQEGVETMIVMKSFNLLTYFAWK